MLFVNDRQGSGGPVQKTVPVRFGLGTFGIGQDSGSPVLNSHNPPFRFTGTIDELMIDLI